MKKLIVLGVVLLGSVSLFAQKFEVGVNSGVSYSSLVNASNPYLVKGWSSEMNRSMWSVKTALVTDKWMYGIAFDYGSYSVKVDQPFIGMFSSFYNAYVPVENYKEKYIATSYHTDGKIFVNRKLSIKRFELYSGMSAGMILLHSIQSGNLYVRNFDNYGYTTGLQFGGTYFVTKHLGANLELAGNYLHFDRDHNSMNIINVPASLGVRYKL
jgi:hypothetical protein